MKKFNRVLSALVAAVMALSATASLAMATGEASDPLVVKSWTFEDYDNWDAVNASTTYLGNGAVKLNVTGRGSELDSPKNLGLETSEIRYMKIRMKHNLAGKFFRVYWVLETDINQAQQYLDFYVNPSNDYVDVVLDMNKTEWDGKLKYFRIVVQDDNAGSGAVWIEKVELLKAPATTEVVWSEDFSDDNSDNNYELSTYNLSDADIVNGQYQYTANSWMDSQWTFLPKKEGAGIWEDGKTYKVSYDIKRLDNNELKYTWWYKTSANSSTTQIYTTNTVVAADAGEVRESFTFTYDRTKHVNGFIGILGHQTTVSIDNITIEEVLPVKVSDMSGIYDGVKDIMPDDPMYVIMDTQTTGLVKSATAPTITIAEQGGGAKPTPTVDVRGWNAGGQTYWFGSQKDWLIITPSGLDYGKTYTMTVSGLKKSDDTVIPTFTINFTTKPYPYMQGITSAGGVLDGYSEKLQAIQFSLKDGSAAGKIAIVAAYSSNGTFMGSHLVTLTDSGASENVSGWVTDANVKTIKAFLWKNDVSPIANALVLTK